MPLALVQGKNMSDGIEVSIEGFYNALINRDVERMMSLFTEDATLSWGPFEFKGWNEIKKWATDLGRMFPKLKVNRGGLIVSENQTFHKFTMEVTTPDGREGLIHGEGRYEFDNLRIRRVWINLTRGYIIIKRGELKGFLR